MTTRQTATEVANIVTSNTTQNLLSAYGLKAHTVTWEDTGRSKGSCWGPNISDMTLTINPSERYESPFPMPVIRKPNFSDVTQDVPIETFKLNYKGSVVTLKEVLEDLKVYDIRDSQILTSSQCCVLPVESGKKTEFAVQLYNYQSRSEDPAVLVILASKDGTSIQVLDSSNTKLYFDDKGTARWFTAERLEDVRIREKAVKTRVDSFKEMTQAEKMDNSIMMIQVPLKQKTKITYRSAGWGAAIGSSGSSDDGCDEMECLSIGSNFKGVKLEGCRPAGAAKSRSKGMDMGQIGLGSSAGSYTGTKGLTLTRDADFPVRCTFQYYRVTDNNTLDEKTIQDIKEQLDQSMKVATAHGSLVLNPTSTRVTEPVLTNQPTNPWVGNTALATFQ